MTETQPVTARVAAEAHEQAELDPYKVRRVTIPPDMRVKMIDWWKNRRHEDLPKDTIPPDPNVPDEPTPKRGIEPDTIRNFPPRAETPDSVTPVGVTTVPMKSLRGIAVGVALVAAALLVVVILFRSGEPARVREPASAVSGTAKAFGSEQPSLSRSSVAAPAASSALSATSPRVDHELAAPLRPVTAASESTTRAAVPPAVRPSVAPRTSTRPLAPEARHPTKSVEPSANQPSTQDPFEKPFFPPAK